MAFMPAHFIDTEAGGQLQRSAFPDADLDALVSLWIAAAEARTDDEAAQEAYVYKEGFTHIANRLAHQPARVDIPGEGSQQYIEWQLRTAQEGQAEWNDKYEDLAGQPTLPGESTGAGGRAGGTVSVPAQVRWT